MYVRQQILTKRIRKTDFVLDESNYIIVVVAYLLFFVDKVLCKARPPLRSGNNGRIFGMTII